jgi:AICAR transformylase/IMP cyclohydrolase PurH
VWCALSVADNTATRDPAGKLFLEVLVSHAYTPEALEWLANKKKNCRVLIAKNDVIRRQRATQEGSLVVRSVFGGLLVQTPDDKGTPDHMFVWTQHDTTHGLPHTTRPTTRPTTRHDTTRHA